MNNEGFDVLKPGTFPGIQIAAGAVPGVRNILVEGWNPTVAKTGTIEDLWMGGGTYTGFSTSSYSTLDIVSTSASDTGTLTLYGLKTPTSTEYETETITLTGTTPVTTVNTWYRCATAYYNAGSGTAMNVGAIDATQTGTPANKYFHITAARGRTLIGAYTVPYMKRAYVTYFSGSCSAVSGAASYARLEVWMREYGKGPLLNLPLYMGVGGRISYNLPIPFLLPALTDISVRVSASSSADLGVSSTLQIIEEVID